MMKPNAEHRRKLVFITGATGDIGRSAVQYFHDNGYRLWLTGRDQKSLALLAEGYPDSMSDVVDLANSESLERLCQKLEQYEQKIDVAFVNAGVMIPGKVVDTKRSVIDSHLDINTRAAIHINHALARQMSQQKHGHIINTLSAAAFISLQDSAAYSASKFGLRGFLIAMADEVKSAGVTVTDLYPSAIDTKMLEFEARNGGSPLNFLAPPSTIEDVIAVLDKALHQKKGQYFIPKGDAFLSKLFCIYPSLLRRFYPSFVKKGEKGRQKYLAKADARET